MAKPLNFPHPYYFYGSDDSTDTDVMIEIPKTLMPSHQHERKALVKSFEQQLDLAWNATLIVIKDGYIADTIYPKAWIDSLNNSLWHTYSLHQQAYPIPIKGVLNRNYLLAIYKAVRTSLTMLTRTQYRAFIKPYLKGIHPFQKKLDALHCVDFHAISAFNQKNTSDATAWKTIAFYVGQNIALLAHDIQVFTKKHLVDLYPDLSRIIYRKQLSKVDIDALTHYWKHWIGLIENWGTFHCHGSIMVCKGERIEMKDEISL